jgi:hypothetical protein
MSHAVVSGMLDDGLERQLLDLDILTDGSSAIRNE